MSPTDGGTMSPTDGGTMNASPLGTSCDAMNPCPAGWLCAVQPAVSVNANTVGYCSKACMSEKVNALRTIQVLDNLPALRQPN